MLAVVVTAAARPARAQGDGGGGPAGPQQSGQVTIQGKAPDRPHSFDVSVAAQWLGPTSLGTQVATMTPNQQNPTSPLTYFSTEGRLQAALGLEGRIAYALTRTLAVEGGLGYRRPQVRISISGDYENGSGTVATENLTEYAFDVALLVHLRGSGFSRARTLPFVEAGVGYVRQIHEGRTLIESGQVYYVGGGFKYLLSRRPGSRISGLGLRVDARACFGRKGLSFSDQTSMFPVVGGGLFVAF
jgi:hypothetical protein